MYNVNDEKLVKSFAEIRAMLDSPYGRGYVDAAYMLPWVYPGNITGIDAENVVKVNRARHYNFANLPDVDSSGDVDWDDYDGDDDIVRTYLGIAADQRIILARSQPEVVPIPSARQLAALLYMMVHWESCNISGGVDRTGMTIDDMQECLDLFVAAFHQAPLCHVKSLVLGEMEIFFDVEFGWKKEQWPEVRKFLEAARFSEKMAHLERTFESECTELFEYFERERVKAEKAAAEARSKRQS